MLSEATRPQEKPALQAPAVCDCRNWYGGGAFGGGRVQIRWAAAGSTMPYAVDEDADNGWPGCSSGGQSTGLCGLPESVSVGALASSSRRRCAKRSTTFTVLLTSSVASK